MFFHLSSFLVLNSLLGQHVADIRDRCLALAIRYGLVDIQDCEIFFHTPAFVSIFILMLWSLFIYYSK